MIVPRNRLLISTAAVTIPLALLGAASPESWQILTLVAGGFAAAVLTDAWKARRSLAGIGVELPSVVRTSKNRKAELELRIRNGLLRRRRLRLALDVPPDVGAHSEEVDMILPAGSEWSRLTWTCTPVKRGNYLIRSAYVESVSPLAFWAPRKTLSVESEIRVYPNLIGDKKAAAVFLNRGAFGRHAVRQTGKGRDFEKLREYTPGDSFDEIHWKAAARRARPITKVFQIERTQEVYAVIDASRLSARDAGGDSILERLITAGLVLGLAAERQGDLFGLLTFSDKIETFVRARNGKIHYGACRDALYRLEPRPVTPDFDELCSFLRLRLRRRALIVFLTSLDDPAIAESFMRNVDLIRRQHLILVNMIRPPGAAPLFTPARSQRQEDVSSVDEIYQRLGGHMRWYRLKQLEKTFQRQGVRFSLLEHEGLAAELISQYLTVKRRQLL